MHLVLDSENSTFQKGNPFSRRNICCAFGWLTFDGSAVARGCVQVDHGGLPISQDALDFLQARLNEATLLIGFNLKYELHWLRRLGITVPVKLRLWDVQVAQFIYENQEKAYPSLAGTSEYWGLQPKYDLIEKEYWANGIDTPDIPWEIVETRAQEDVLLTYDLYKKQIENLPESKRVLISLAQQDLRILAEMEWNGLTYDADESLKQAKITNEIIAGIDGDLNATFGGHPFNWNSVDHCSAVLYGGVIRFRVATPYEHTYKGGKKAGTTETRFKHSSYDQVFERIVEPLPKSELAKPGYWSTSDDTLKQLRPSKKAKRVVDLLRKRSDLEKLASTYYVGFPKKIEEMDWEPNTLHGQLNQCVVITGRLSSSGPNLQNLLDEAKALVKSRHVDSG